MIEEFRLAFCQFIFSIKEKEGIFPEFKASILWEDDFREAVKSRSCRITRSSCDGCPLLHGCTYALLYEVEVMQQKRLRQLFPVLPPFAWSFPPERKTTYLPREKIVFGLTLFGSGIKHLAILFNSIQDFFEDSPRGKKTGAVLQEARLENPFTGARCPFYCREGESARDEELKEAVITGEQIEKWAYQQPRAGRFSLRFHTPLLIQLEGEHLKKPVFPMIFRELVKRVSLLLYQFHGYKEMDLNYNQYMEEAMKIEIIRDNSRFVSWEQFPKSIYRPEGIIGETSYEGLVNPFIPLLKLGEFTNLGAGSTFGLGRYNFRIIHLKAF